MFQWAGPDTTKPKFPKQSALIHLFEESGPQGIGDLKDGAYHAFSERVWASAFIGVHRRLIIMCPADLIILRLY